MKDCINFLTKVITFVVLFAMIISFTSYGENPASPTLAPSKSALNDDGWEIWEDTDTILSKCRTTDYGRSYSFTVNYIDVSDKVAENDLSKDALTVFSQWALYLFTFDMNIHTPLFYEKHLDDKLYTQFDDIGYDKDTALKLIEQNANILFPFKKVELNAMITEFSVNNTDAINDIITYNNMFTEYNMSKDKLGDVFCISAAGTLFLDDLLYYDLDLLKQIIIFEYDSKLYMHFKNLDDDLSIDILSGNIQENIFPFRLEKESGRVTSIDEKYICIDGNKFYHLKNYDSEMTVAVGEYAEISYYSMGIGLNKKIDNEACEVGVAIDINKYERFYQD